MSLRETLLSSIQDKPEAKASYSQGISWKLVALFLGCLAVIVLAPAFGSTRIDIFKALDFSTTLDENLDRYLLVYTRLPRVFLGVIVGAGLAMAGVAYQAMLRNDLAEPFSLGIAAGSAFGALLAFHIMPAGWAGWSMPVFAFFGALISLMAIILMSQNRRGALSPATLILAGVTINFLFGAAILLLQYMSDPYQTVMLIRWTMGGLDLTSYTVPVALAGLLFLSFVILYRQTGAMDLLSFGEESAHHLGVNVRRVRLVTLFVASLLTACLVAFAGPIGFVGLIVPHAMRLLFGARHSIVLVSSAIAGGTFLVVCDAFARTLLSPTELPVGIITALIGGPVFLILLLRKPI